MKASPKTEWGGGNQASDGMLRILGGDGGSKWTSEEISCSAETLTMLFVMGWGCRCQSLTRGQKKAQERAMMKDRPFMPTTESCILWLLFYQIAFGRWGAFLNNTIS